MLVASISGVRSSTQLRIEKPVSKILIKLYNDDTSVLPLLPLQELITIKKVTRSNSHEKNIATSIPLGHLAVLNSYLEGSFDISFELVSNMPVLAYASFTIDLAYLGGLRLNSDNYVSIDLVNLHPHFRYEVYGLEYLGQSALFEDPAVYSFVSLPQGERVKQFDLSQIDLFAVERAPFIEIDDLLLPQRYSLVANGLDRVQLSYINGAVANLTPSELASLNMDTNDISAYVYYKPYSLRSVPTYSSHLYMVDVEDAASVEVSKTSSTDSINLILVNFPNQ